MEHLTPEQRAAGTARSRLTRQVRADTKKALARGHITFAELVVVPECRQLRVVDALMVLPGVGPQRAAQLMTAAGISPTRRVGGLGVRQREALLAALR